MVELFQESSAPQAKRISTFDHFCVRCKSGRSFCHVTEIRTRLGQKALKGYCRACGCKSIKFLSGPVLVSIAHKPRRTLLDRVGIEEDAKTHRLGRRNLINRFGLERVKAVFNNISDVNRLAQMFDCDRVTIYRTARKLKQIQLQKIVLEPTDKLLQQEDAQRWCEWLQSRMPNHYRWFVGVVEEIWRICWNKQHIICILSKDEYGEANIIKAVTHINNLSQGKRYNAFIALRSLIRYGFGNPAWLQRHLTTKDKKCQPRKIPVLHLQEFPALWNRIIELAKENADEDERDEIELILNVKTAIGIRTGKRRYEKELWGTRIGEGKSSIYIHNNTVVWQIFAKANETWQISLIPIRVKNMLLDYIRKRGLRQGDWLINMKTGRANEILGEASSKVLNYRLRLHDCRKIFITYLKRAGVGIEDIVSPTCQCPFGVTWKDANTAYRHYLEVVDADQIKAHKKFSDMFFT